MQTGFCEGCWRTLEEIAIWGMADESVKQAIWEKINQRKLQQNLSLPENGISKAD